MDSPRAEKFFRNRNVSRTASDAPSWKTIKDEADKRRDQITAKLRIARLAKEADEAAARESASSAVRRPRGKKNKRHGETDNLDHKLT